MGITITAGYPDAPSYSMGYISFWNLRKAVATAADPKFGEIYADLPKVGHIINPKDYEKRMSDYLKKHPLPLRFLDFLYQSDTDGSLSPCKCKAVYDQICHAEHMKPYKLYGYTAQARKCMTWEQFKELLLGCYSNKSYMKWS